jgi:ferric-dicitrate binding protein FerR (iron transport regulator)
MESESKYDDVVIRYLLKEAGPEEERFVLEWIKADEKNRLFVEELRKTLQLITLKQDIKKIDVDTEWEQFCNQVLKKQALVVQPDEYEIPEPEIRNGEKRGGKIYKIILATAIAASVILIIGTGSGWFTNNYQQENKVSQQAGTTENRAKIDPLMVVVQHEINTSGKIKKFTLSDGSEVALFDRSELTYKEPVNGSRRDVYLVGKADFKVAKNKAKPFTVFSGAISTTAIGTVFTVTAKQNEKYIRVRLDEGKVVVKSVKGYNRKWTKEFYMSPGQELMFDKDQQTIAIQSSENERVAVNKSNQEKDNPAIPHYDKRSWFMFNNQSLSEIFDALAEMYDTKIEYSKQDVKNMYFIGTYDKSDSLEKILNQIALLNNLKVTKLNDAFKIEKQISKR